MTTETACLSSVWATGRRDKGVPRASRQIGRLPKALPADGAGYDGVLEVDLSEIEPMIALPSHPSNAYALREVIEEPERVLREAGLEQLLPKVHDGSLWVDQGVIAGCAGGTYDNLCAAADILGGAA